MTGTPGSPSGRVRGLIADDEPAPTEVLSVAASEAGRWPCPAVTDGRSALRLARGCSPYTVADDNGRPPVIRTVRGPVYTIRPVEDGR